MKRQKLFDILLIFLLIAVISLMIYGFIRLRSEEGQCVLNPIAYYEETYNTTVCQQYGGGPTFEFDIEQFNNQRPP